MIKNKYRVCILGCTGMVGQRFILMLNNHPWFDVVKIAASYRSKGKLYKDVVDWKLEKDMPEYVKNMLVEDILDIDNVSKDIDLIFSAFNLSKKEIFDIEQKYALKDVPVVSNNSAHRLEEDVPMVIPELNIDHFKIIESQRKRLNVKNGFIVAKPNCSIQSYIPALYAWKSFEPYEVVVSTYQAISGTGKVFREFPEIEGNIIPYIAGEEFKSEYEPLKIFGNIEGDKIKNAIYPKITSQCIRVPILNGHTASIFVKFKKNPLKEELINALINYKGFIQDKNLPSSPKNFIKYLDEVDRPQVKYDVDYENGMGVTFGRLREDTIYDYKFIGLSHNTIRGAAGGGILCAEALVSLGYINKR